MQQLREQVLEPNYLTLQLNGCGKLAIFFPLYALFPSFIQEDNNGTYFLELT